MHFIGIDVAKDKHECCLLNGGDGTAITFTFANSHNGFTEFLSRVKSRCGDEKLKVGLESTGHYTANLLSFLNAHGFEVAVFNPLSVSLHSKADSLRRTKTDKNDSRYLAQMLMAADFKPYQKPSYHNERLKSLTRARFRLVGELQPVKNRFRRLLQILFPEIQGFFSPLYSPTALSLLEKFPSAKDIASANIVKLRNILSVGRMRLDKPDSLKALAKTSVGTYDAGAAFELKMVVQRIVFLTNQKMLFDEEIKAVMDELKSPITSIPGIGMVLGATILAEIGNRNFETSAKLLAFAGCEPATYQSGNYTATKTKMVKRGSRYMRWALFLATRAARIHSPSFAAYLSRKKSQGKHEFVALTHGMKKLIRIIHTILTKNIQYSEPF